MKLHLLALAVIPVLVGGIVVTTAVSVLDTAETPNPTPTLGKSIGDRSSRADTAGTAGGTVVGTTGPGDGTVGPGDGTRIGPVDGPRQDARAGNSSESGGDTEIDGRRPHLTVIDGRPTVAPPGAIPAALSILPPPAVGLPPLADLGGELAWPTDDGDPQGRTSRGAGERFDPGARGAAGDDWTDASTSPGDGPDSSPSRGPGDPSALDAEPERPSQNDDRAEPGSGARPPAGRPGPNDDRAQPGSGARPPAGRPGRPPSESINSPFPSESLGLPGTKDPVGRPGTEDAVDPPRTVDPAPLAPSSEPLTPVPGLPSPETVVPEKTSVPGNDLPQATAVPKKTAVPGNDLPQATAVPKKTAVPDNDLPQATAAPKKTAVPDNDVPQASSVPANEVAGGGGGQPQRDESSNSTAEADSDDSQPPLR